MQAIEENPSVLDAIVALAKNLEIQEEPSEAEYLLTEAVNLCKSIYGPRSARNGLVLLELMSFYERQGKVEQAESLMSEIRRLLIGCIKAA